MSYSNHNHPIREPHSNLPFLVFHSYHPFLELHTYHPILEHHTNHPIREHHTNHRGCHQFLISNINFVQGQGLNNNTNILAGSDLLQYEQLLKALE